VSNKAAYLGDHPHFRFHPVDLTGSEAFYQDRRYMNVVEHLLHIPLASMDRILDVGCGPGVIWRDYKKNLSSHLPPDLQIIGVDLSFSSLQEFTIVGKSVQTDGEWLPFLAGTFRLVMCIDVIEHFHSPEALLREIRRVVQKSGYLLVSTPNAHGVYEHKAVFNLGRKPTCWAVEDLLKGRWIRGIPSPSFPQHVKLYSFPELQRTVEAFGFRLVCGHMAGFALPAFGLIERFTGLYAWGWARRVLVALESKLPWVCWNMVALFEAV
jgi:ubiquinone/menaquinone biosynthesis C-methylase UbiE